MHVTTHARTVDVVSDRADEWRRRLEMIQRARRFLFLTTYYFDGDARSLSLADALIQAAQRGVQVVLVIDAFGHRLSKNLQTPEEQRALAARLTDLEGAGARVVWWRPRRRAHRWLGGGMHVKIQVSEEGRALFGSSNVARHSYERWNELGVEVTGAVAGELLREACVLSGDHAGPFVAHLPPDTEAGVVLDYARTDPTAAPAPFFPLGSVENALTDRLVAFIDAAQRTLAITTLYCKPCPALLHALVRARQRGVEVEIFHSHRDSLGVTHIPWIPASLLYARLLRAGVRIHESTHGEHSKVFLVDGERCAVGSYNLEHAAHNRLVEAMVFTKDNGVCRAVGAFFSALRSAQHNALVPSTWLAELPWRLRVMRWLYRPLQRWL